MAKGQKFEAVLPDGTIATRTSQTKVYTHVVAVFSTPWNATEPRWGVYRWSQNERNAFSGLREVRRLGWANEVQIVKVTEPVPSNAGVLVVDPMGRGRSKDEIRLEILIQTDIANVRGKLDRFEAAQYDAEGRFVGDADLLRDLAGFAHRAIQRIEELERMRLVAAIREENEPPVPHRRRGGRNDG